MKRAIEAEYWVTDREGRLTTPGALTEISEYVEPEFVEPLLEVKTPPCESDAELRSTFVEQLDLLLDSADEAGKLLVPLGTPIGGAEIRRNPSERSRIQEQVLGTDLDYANYCAGTHFHFEQADVTDQLNVLIGLDPALAVLNSSPYFRGRPVANGARPYLYRKKCYEHFPKHGQLWDYVDSVDEWETRLGHRFEEFKAAALRAGVDEAAVDAHFSPDTVVWTPVRLRDAMPTVEWRSPDVALPSQTLHLAREIGTVMDRVPRSDVRVEGHDGRVGSDEIVLPEFEDVCDYAEAAIHEGTESRAVSAYLDRMGVDVSGYQPISLEIGGMEYVDAQAARELRRRYGTRLRQDVASLLDEQSMAP